MTFLRRTLCAVTLAGLPVLLSGCETTLQPPGSRVMVPAALELHPDNPHYFRFRGRAAVVITSGEHYGALINQDFDFRTYLAALAKDGLNGTRVFSGAAYVEPQGAFNIAGNTLAPAEGRFLAPWARSDQPGYAGGGNRFDLTRFDESYFARLADLMEEASRHGIIVEMNLFCPFYGEEQWELSPFHAGNNVNGWSVPSRTDVYTLDRSGPLLDVQMSFVERIVHELNRFDNLYWEICNEPYFGGVTLEWQYAVAERIAQLEKELPNRHLISRNVANAGRDELLAGHGKVWREHPAVSILNFHYANPPLVVPLNYGLDRVIGENETGFRGTGDEYYRREAWEFILAGGALFNHLDYSFVVGHEDGTFVYPESQPGGGSPALRRQFGILKRFIESFDFVRMRPDNTVIRGGIPRGGRAQVLAEPGRQYAVYVREGETLELQLKLPAGAYRYGWLDPRTGETIGSGILHAAEGIVTLAAPGYSGEVALRIVAEEGT